jgi:succinate-semialdehyde dehydrogenase/glutarate-semialdehyde dehydrogenase
MQQAKLLIGGAWVDGVERFDVVDKHTGKPIGSVQGASREQVGAAVQAARRSFAATALEPHARGRVLHRTAQLIAQHRERLATTIVAESGIPWKDADNEVARSIETFTVSGEEAKRLAGEVVPIDGAPGQAHRMAFTVRVPRGVVGAITSFNSPLNMVAHKVAPALAAGNTVVVKPPQATPLSATILCELLLQAGVPPSHVNLVHGGGSTVGRWLVEDAGLDFITFTGSTEVGKAIRRSAGLKPVALELGSIAATVVCDDGDLQKAALRCSQSGFRRAGQACTSTQRLFVQAGVLDRFVPMLLEATRALKVGDPHDKDTDVGPMISEAEAARAERVVAEAVSQGARLLLGGTRQGALLQPAILIDVRPDMRVMAEEVFAPVLSIVPFASFDDAVRQVNATPFGLAAGVFTRDLMRAMEAARRLHVGVVHINDASSSRVDLMPFAGVKDSGVGTEGPRYAMREMTEERLVTMSLDRRA